MSASFRYEWSPKMLREKLCVQLAFAPDKYTYRAIETLIHIIDLHRPLDQRGVHGDLHTPTCGCEDK